MGFKGSLVQIQSPRPNFTDEKSKLKRSINLLFFFRLFVLYLYLAPLSRISVLIVFIKFNLSGQRLPGNSG